MNLRINMRAQILVFGLLSMLSSVVSANWFENYNSSQLIEAPKIISNTSVFVVRPNLETNKTHSQPQPLLAPSFDIVAREMEQIKVAQIAYEYGLITYLQDGSTINIE